MADNQNPPGEKGRKTRPFGSFLLFLVVLVVVLIAFGGDTLGRSQDLSQDVFEWFLYTGRVEKLDFKGENEIRGELTGGTRFKVSFTSLADREALYRELAAIRAYRPIKADDLLTAIEEGWYQPTVARHLTAYEELPAPDSRDPEEEHGAEPLSVHQQDRVLVGVTARARASFESETRNSKNPYNLPDESGYLWLAVNGIEDFGSFERALTTAGAKLEWRSFNLSKDSGTTHGKAGPSLLDALLIYGPWLLIFSVFLLFMRQMRQQGSGAGVMSFGRSRAQLYTKENRTNVT